MLKLFIVTSNVKAKISINVANVQTAVAKLTGKHEIKMTGNLEVSICVSTIICLYIRHFRCQKYDFIVYISNIASHTVENKHSHIR